jgi:predicted RNA-binding Zn ribbon-like protein
MIIDGYELSLDFANSSEWRSAESADERLRVYETVLEWAREEDVLDGPGVESLRALARSEPEKAGEALLRVVTLREAVYRIFASAAHSCAPQAGDLGLLNNELAEAMVHMRLAPQESDQAGAAGFAWTWEDMGEELTSVLWPVVKSAAELLTSPQLVRLRDCANESCGWLFLDHSKNASRRWCDMGECGNREKAKRFRERKKSEPARDS